MIRHASLTAAFRAFIAAALFLTASVFPAFSQTEGAGSRGGYLTIKVAVMGPGDQLYFRWGHAALIIEDAVTGKSRFYDWGIFSFDADHFFVNFAFGRLIYRCGASPSDSAFRQYRATNRDITVYMLDLPDHKKEEIRRFAEWNILPENRNYYYHHFKDNCATRIRDILDIATDGQFNAAFGAAPGQYTLRQQIKRHLWSSPFYDWILNFWMGQDIDAPTTVWQEMFLPQKIGDCIQDFTYRDPDGRVRKLVTSVEAVNRSVNRPPVLAAPCKLWPGTLAVSLAAVILLGVFSAIRRRRPAAGRVLLGVSHALFGLFFGTAGALLFFMALFTNHDYTYHNSNLIYANPLLLAAVPLGVMAARGRSRAKRPEKRKRFRPPRVSPENLLRILWTYVFLGGVLSMALKLLPWFYQQNQADLALILPIALALALLPLERGKPPGGEIAHKAGAVR
ncbi:MAG: DUF4105 domain-containing protein [Spirochaetaceae bacterium]|nr:DUF4105 domain-containing protein [Spirochaetaceae bacterium]